MKKYLLFDLDGTLTDPKVGITTCVQYALAAFGIEEPDLDKLEPFIGPPLKDSFMEFYHMDEVQAQAAVDKYRERFKDTGIFENKLYDGIPGLLQALNSQGMFMAVASSKPTVFVEQILEHFGIAKYFKVVVGSELDGTRVDKDQVVEEALKRLFGDKPVDKDQVYMIGDRKFDAEGARAQGVESVCVTYGYGSMEELKEAKADYIVRSVEELKKFLLRGTEKPGGVSFQTMWPMLFAFLMFILVRNVAANFLTMFFLQAGDSGVGGEFFFFYDEDGVLAGFTGNVSTLISAFGFAVSAACLWIWGSGKAMLQQTAEDMKLLHLKREPGKNYVLLFFLAVGAVMGLNLLFDLTGVTQLSLIYQKVAEDQHSAGLLVGLVCYGIISPVAEELLFRGVIYGHLRKIMKLPLAMIASALIFGLYHGNTVQGIYGFLMSLLMVYAYEYFGDFKAAVAIHVIANGLAYSLEYTSLAVSGISAWPVCIVFLAVMAVSFFLLHRQKKVF